MPLKSHRSLGLAAAVAAVALLAASAAALQQGGAGEEPQATETTPASPPVKVKAGQPAQSAPAPGRHDHSAMGKAPAESRASDGRFMTIVGEVMDPACFLEAGSKSIGPGHYQCAYDCARSGQTLAIYARDQDRIYFVAGELPGKNPNEPLLAYIHKKVDVTGTVYHRSDAWGIVINKVALHEEKPATPGGKAAAATGARAGN